MTKYFKIIFLLLLLLLLNLADAADCEDIKKELSINYIIKSGDTLDLIASKYLKTKERTIILQAINGITEPNNIKSGSSIIVPISTRYFVQPFISDEEETFDIMHVFPFMRASDDKGVVVGITTSFKEQNRKRFRAVYHYKGEQKLIFDSNNFDLSELWPLGLDWYLDDLDGDGDVDVVLFDMEGSGNFLSIYCFHFINGKFERKDLIPSENAIGICDVKWERSLTGSRQFKIIHYGCKSSEIIKWSK